MDQSIIRISKELSEIQKSSDLSLAVACQDSNVRNVKAIIMGPHETPYEFGFFEFNIKITKDYPSKSPVVTGTTTNGGRCRFNPNIYANGKVCLSILGTWRGERSEEWSSAQGLESILLSIQSLMSTNPYENEPGYEHQRGDSDKQLQKDYVEKIRHESLRVSVIQRLEGYLGINAQGERLEPLSEELVIPEDDLEEDDDKLAVFSPFQDLCKRRFLWYFDSYLAAVKQGKANTEKNKPFVQMPFESPTNGMEGKFHYYVLEKRLRQIKKALDEEVAAWAKQGPMAVKCDTRVAANLQRQYNQVISSLRHSDLPHNITLEDGNPFVWVLTYFGRPMTNFDGGLFRIKMHFSPKFPEEQPRVRFETKIFHHHIATDGTVCYTPDPLKKEDVKSHVEAIIGLLEEDDPAYDPRKTVNPEASKMYWGKAEDKKMYSRKLRRSVQDSMEDFGE